MTSQQQIEAVRQQLISDHARLFAVENEAKVLRERITSGSNFLAGVQLQQQATDEAAANAAALDINQGAAGGSAA